MKSLWSMDIDAPRERVWHALTQPGIIQPFYFNSRFDADLRPDGEMKYRTADGKRVLIEAKVLEIETGAKLVHEFRFTDISEPAQVVTFELEDIESGTRVRIRHSGLEAAPKHASRVSHGWNHILKNLKHWVEKGSLPLSARLQHGMMHLMLKAMPNKA
jgi:uncharacterized protein YndB with AHSA1/START domain